MSARGGLRVADPATAVLEARLDRLLGGPTANALEGLGLRSGEDLLRHFPRRYFERGELSDLAELREGQDVTIAARVVSSETRPIRGFDKQGRRRTMTKVVVTDGTTQLSMTFFGGGKWRDKQLPRGQERLFAGRVEAFRGVLQLTNPHVEEGEDADAFAGEVVPIYPATKDIPSWRVRKAVATVLDQLPPDLPDPLPADVRAAEHLPDLRTALRLTHRPATPADPDRARARFRYEEAYVLQTVLAQRRAALAALPAVPRRPVPGGLLDAFDERLPFELTAGQRAVGAEIAADLARDSPMHRLLQGEVGSGKTLVALRAMLTVVDAGAQCALLAPTEVLAQQHHRSITALLGPLAEGGLLGGDARGTQVVLLTGSQPAAARRRALLAVASGDAGIVVGTHALLEEHVEPYDLGLVVVDEQHRFGVEQRDALRAKAVQPPHVLVMTATPIPRTVAITVFGDLDVSTLEELPAGRGPLETHVVPADRPAWVARTWSRVREEVDAGHVAYVVCPRIGEPPGSSPDATGGPPGTRSRTPTGGAADPPDPPDPSDWYDPYDDVGEELPLDLAPDAAGPPQAVLEVVEQLRARPELAGVVLDVLHGRLTAEAKDDVMARFAAGEVQVLVATTVVEVGVDVATATAMVVLDADRFGVSQLHQLRGRVGRGGDPAVCLLLTAAPPGTPARERVEAVAATLDGFELSRLDLEQRREGDVLGAAQAGRRSSLRSLAVVRDERVIRAARSAATALVDGDPQLADHPALARAVAAQLDADRADYLAKA